MENASKALLIAGAILIAILLIGIGMLIFGNIGGFTYQAQQQTDAMQIEMFNRQFQQYAGKNVSGSNVRTLLRNINTNNVTNKDDASKQIIGASASEVKTTPTSATAGTASKFPDTVINGIGANYRYEVSFGTDASGFINSVTIKQVK